MLAPLGHITWRRMFSSHGLYCDGCFIAIIHDGTLWLKTDALTRDRFIAAGGEQFTYQRQGRPAALGFHTPPPDALEMPHEMLQWGRLALEAALRSRKLSINRSRKLSLDRSRNKKNSTGPGEPANRRTPKRKAAKKTALRTPRAPGDGSRTGSTPSPPRRRG